MKYNVSVYPKSFKGKDKSYMNASAKKITKLIPKYCQNLSVAELAAAIENMYVFCPATFIGDHKSQGEMASIQFFALDFDGGIDIDTAIARAEHYKLPIAIRYETSSSVNWSKFRLIFLCCQEVQDKDLAVLIQYCLCTIFPEVDNTSKDFCKLYYPGKNVICSGDVSFSIYDLLISTILYLSENDPKNKVRKLEQISKKSHVVILKNTFAIAPNSVTLPSGALLPPPPPPSEESEESETILEEIAKSEDFIAMTIYNNMVDVTKSSNFYQIYFSEGNRCKITEKRRRKQLCRVDISADSYCRLLNDFISGRRLPHEEWYGLSLNLIHIMGGRSLISEVFDKYSSIYNDTERKETQIDFAVRNEYRAQRCEDYCPYAYKCEHASNMVYTLKEASRKIIILDKKPEYKDIEIMRSQLRSEIEASLARPRIKVMKAPTGAGKTYAYLEAVKNSDKQTIVAVPNRMLMDDIADAARSKGISCITTPIIYDLIKSLDHDKAKLLRHMYTVGTESNVNYYLREWDDIAAKNYLDQIGSIRKFKGKLIITTHARLLKMKSDYLSSRNVIIDEDILPSMIQVRSVRISDIDQILNRSTIETPMPCDVVYQLNRIKRIKGYESIEGLSRDFNTDETLSITERISYENNSAIFPALRARHFYHEDGNDEIFFGESTSLPECNCIIVSATVNEMLYRRVFGNRLYSFKDMGELRYHGKLYLHHDRSYSKSCIMENTDIIDELRQEYGSHSNIITFKDFSEYGELYLGAAQGSNMLAGQDLTVIGTFHRPEYVYKLWWMIIGAEATEDTLAVRRIERNGFNFPFMTFSDPVLREIQLYMIESESEQAVGRARLVSNDCTVNLFSNLPLKQSILLND